MSRFQMPTEPKNGLDLLRWVIFEPVLFERFKKMPHYPKNKIFWSLMSVISIAFYIVWSTENLNTVYLLPLVFGIAVGFAFWLIDGLIFGFVVGFGIGLIFALGSGMFFGIIFGFTFGLCGGLGFILAFYLTYFRLPFYPFHFIYGLFAHNFEQNPHLKDGSIWLPLFLLNKQLLRLAYAQPEMAIEFAEFLLEYRPLQRKLACQLIHAATAGIWQRAGLEMNADNLRIPIIPEDQAFVKFRPSERWNLALDQLRQQLIAAQKQSHVGLQKEAYEKFFELLQAFHSTTILESLDWSPYYQQAIKDWMTITREKIETLKLRAEIEQPISSADVYRSGEALSPEKDDYAVFVGRNDLKEQLASEIWTARQMPLFLIQGQRRVGKTSLLKFLPELLGVRFKVVYQDLQGLYPRTVKGWLIALQREIDKTLSISRRYESRSEKLSSALLLEIANFLASLPNITDESFRKTLLIHTGLTEVINHIETRVPAAIFIPHLVSFLTHYGTLNDGRNPLVALLEIAKEFVGRDRQAFADELIDKLVGVSNFEHVQFDYVEKSERDDWLRNWDNFKAYLEQITNGKDFKLVLAFDEYEILHDKIFQQDKQQADRLLGAMRSFSQQQNQVVFLFAGARFFSELQQPNWNEYFVQVKHLRVDYLKRPDVLHLIQRPTPDFGLVYADDLANHIFDLTQGHPALVQQICSEMVNLANTTNHRNMTHDDVTQVLAEKTLFRENLTIQIFWTQFCSPADRVTVKQILAGTPPTDPVSRYRLELHGYIVKDGEGWKMRVPLFEEWLRKFIETFPL